MTLSTLLSASVWVGSDEQVTALRQAARDHAWEGPAIVDPEFAADAVMANVEARDVVGFRVEASKEALEVYRVALVDSAEQAMVRS